MSEHAWTVGNLATYVAGGLDAAEREQLERHAAECDPCMRALAAARAADRKLLALFADARPSPTLEDRMIRTLRQGAAPARSLHWSGWAKAVLATAAVALLAVTGVVVESMVDEDPTPGEPSYGLLLSRLFPKELAARTPRVDRESPIDAADQKRARRLTRAWSESARGDDLLSLGVSPEAKHLDTNMTYSDNRMSEWNVTGSPTGGEALDGVKVQPEVTSNGPATTKFEIGSGFNTDNGLIGSITLNEKKTGKATDAPAAPAASGGASSPTSPYQNLVQAPPPPKTPPVSVMKGYFKPGDAFRNPPGDAKGKEIAKEPAVPPLVKGGDKVEGHASFERPKSGMELAKIGGEKPPVPDPAPGPQKIVIRSGDVEYEVDSFDAALAVVQKLIASVKGGYIGTINRTRLENGKTRGSVVVRVPPERLDQLLLDLRTAMGKTGELKGQRIGSQDITKQYTDLQSRLRAARAMEERLLRMIKDGKGAIKDLLDAEKELGVWRTRIEESEGELRYYGNLVALSTLTISLTEKEIRVAASVSQIDRVQTQVEVEDVEAAMQKVLKAVEDAKGRVTRSELKQEGLHQLSAVLEFEVPPKEAGAIRVALRQLGGTIAQLKVDRVQRAEGGAKLPRNGKLDQGDTEFQVHLYNLAKVQPRETIVLKVAAPDVAAAYRALRTALEKPIQQAKATVKSADLNEQDRQRVGAQLDFEIHWTEQKAVLTTLAGAGETLSRHVTRAPEGENVTDKKILYRVELIPATSIEPRKAVTLEVEVTDVEQALSVLTARVKEVQGRIVKGPVTGQSRNGRVMARVVYDVPLSEADAVVEKVKRTGQVRLTNEAPNPQAPEGKLALARIDVTLATADMLVPREEGVGAYLSVSLRALSLSVSWLLVGVLAVLPWALLIGAVVWIARRVRRPAVKPPVAS